MFTWAPLQAPPTTTHHSLSHSHRVTLDWETEKVQEKEGEIAMQRKVLTSNYLDGKLHGSHCIIILLKPYEFCQRLCHLRLVAWRYIMSYVSTCRHIVMLSTTFTLNLYLIRQFSCSCSPSTLPYFTFRSFPPPTTSFSLPVTLPFPPLFPPPPSPSLSTSNAPQ